MSSHPGEWSADYRTLIRRVALAMARRPVEDLVPIPVERQTTPPGVMRFVLQPLSEEDPHRRFHFRFDRPTAFTATLEHTGSSGAMLLFYGGKKMLHATRVDAENGETMTIAANIGEAAIRAVDYRYWVLQVMNFDAENACSAKLTIRYDRYDTEGEIRIQALPGNASFEYINGLAAAHLRTEKPELAVGDGTSRVDAARLATARTHGFASWEHLDAHVAWKPQFDMRGGTFGVNRFYAVAKERYGESFTVEQLADYAEDFTDDLRATLDDAFARAKAAGHAALSDSHLLLALLGDAAASHALSAAGGVIDALRGDLEEALAAAERGDCAISKVVCGAVYRGHFIGALGREGTNTANVLAGLLGEKCPATDLLRRQDVRQRDIVDYVTHGVARVAAGNQQPQASAFSAELEESSRAAFVKARTERSKYLTLEHLLLGLIASARLAEALGAAVAELREELAAFIAATALAGTADEVARPTRAFSRVMQMAVAKARSRKREQATPADALWALAGERDVPTAEFLARCEITRAGVDALTAQ